MLPKVEFTICEDPFRLTCHRKSNHRKKFSFSAHPILSCSRLQFLRIRFSNENKRTRKTGIRKSIGSGTMRLPPRKYPSVRIGRFAKQRNREERRIGSPSNDVSPAVGDRFRRRKPRTSGNLITSRRSTALIRDLSRWTGRRAAKIEPALPPPPRREREGGEHARANAWN